MPARKPQPSLAELLAKANLDPQEGRDLLAFVAKKTTSYFVAHPESTLTPGQQAQFLTLAAKRRRGEPFAYLIGRQGFYGLDFIVMPDVLIPRPETEQLVDWALAHVNRKTPTTIVDVGTGSGCITVTLAKYLPQAKLIASDVSEKALAVARKNARAHKVSSRIAFRRGSLLSVLTPEEKADLVVANLPYLTADQLKNLPREPRLALDGGRHGLELVNTLIEQIVGRQIPQAILEIAPQQERWLIALADRTPNYHFTFLPDLTKRTRFFVVQKN